MSCLLFSQILHEDINFSIDKNKQTYSKSHTDGRPRHNVGGIVSVPDLVMYWRIEIGSVY